MSGYSTALERQRDQLLAENAALKQQRDALVLAGALAAQMLEAATRGTVTPTTLKGVADDLNAIIDRAEAAHA